MGPRDQTAAVEFLLLGRTDDPVHQPLIFSGFMSVYLVIIVGNLLITLAPYIPLCISSSPICHLTASA
jgi:hypothetical protein